MDQKLRDFAMFSTAWEEPAEKPAAVKLIPTL